jgi:hypothetical protein
MATAKAERGTGSLQAALREFVSAHPEGWDHGEWMSFLERIRERGFTTDDPDEIGRQLERERLALRLEQVKGVGPARVRSVVDRYGTLWELSQADVDEIAAVPNISRGLAEEIQHRIG